MPKYIPDEVIAIAKQEVGYLEKKNGDTKYLYDKTTNAGSNNYTKYGYEMHKIYPKTMDYPAAWCFLKGTLVLTDNGYKDISELIIGDKVLSADGTHFNNVIKTMSHEDDIYALKIAGSLPTYSTKDHPYLAKKRIHITKDEEFSDTTFFPLWNLSKGDSVAMSITKFSNTLDLSYSDAWLIGYFVGNGWRSKGKYFICGDNKKCSRIEFYARNLYKEHNIKNCQRYILSEYYSYLFNILNECGHKDHNKKVPASILYANDNIKHAFLNGYLDAADYDYTKFNTVSKELAFGICKIATDLEYGISLRLNKRDSIYDFHDERYDKYTDIYEGFINTSSCALSNDDYSYHTIKSVENIMARDIVYNITTDGDHTYIANNVCVHNCDCFVDWCFYKAYGTSTAQSILHGNFDDYTVNSAGMYKNKKAWYEKNPKVGDQIFFKNSSGKICHTGLVYKVDSKYVYTIEGNTSSAAGVVANGGCVTKKQYLLTYNRIAGYGRPKYATDTKPATTTSKPTIPPYSPTLAYGSKGQSVKNLQKCINYIKSKNTTKYKFADLKVDGAFGNKTKSALTEIQKANGIVSVINVGIYNKVTYNIFVNLIS